MVRRTHLKVERRHGYIAVVLPRLDQTGQPLCVALMGRSITFVYVSKMLLGRGIDPARAGTRPRFVINELFRISPPGDETWDHLPGLKPRAKLNNDGRSPDQARVVGELLLGDVELCATVLDGESGSVLEGRGGGHAASLAACPLRSNEIAVDTNHDISVGSSAMTLQ